MNLYTVLIILNMPGYILSLATLIHSFGNTQTFFGKQKNQMSQFENQHFGKAWQISISYLCKCSRHVLWCEEILGATCRISYSGKCIGKGGIFSCIAIVICLIEGCQNFLIYNADSNLLDGIHNLFSEASELLLIISSS